MIIPCSGLIKLTDSFDLSHRTQPFGDTFVADDATTTRHYPRALLSVHEELRSEDHAQRQGELGVSHSFVTVLVAAKNRTCAPGSGLG